MVAQARKRTKRKKANTRKHVLVLKVTVQRKFEKWFPRRYPLSAHRSLLLLY